MVIRIASSGCSPRFNEAAGIPRGRQTMMSGGSPAHRRFNEAAGIPRGRLLPATFHQIRFVLLQ